MTTGGVAAPPAHRSMGTGWPAAWMAEETRLLGWMMFLDEDLTGQVLRFMLDLYWPLSASFFKR